VSTDVPHSNDDCRSGNCYFECSCQCHSVTGRRVTELDERRELENLLLEYVASTQPTLLETVRRLVALQDSQREMERYEARDGLSLTAVHSCSICDEDEQGSSVFVTVLSDEDVEDIITTATEGGINYWAGPLPRLSCNAEVVRRGFALLLDSGYILYDPSEPGAMDAGEADMVVQYGLFGEVRYS